MNSLSPEPAEDYQKIEFLLDEIGKVGPNPEIQKEYEMLKGYAEDCLMLFNAAKGSKVLDDLSVTRLRHYASQLLKGLYTFKSAPPRLIPSKEHEIKDEIGQILRFFEEPKNEFKLTYSFLVSCSQQHLNKRTAQLVNSLESESSRLVIRKYANIFKKEALYNSSFFKKYENEMFLGSAEKWIALGILLITSLIIYVTVSTGNIDLYYKKLDLKSEELIMFNYFELGKRIVISSLLLFLIGFTFKQYKVSRHLYILNNHRANAFDSYNLFSDSIGDDKETRNLLLLELAKVIYEHNQSGMFTEEKSESNLNILNNILTKRGAS